jgi:hypothetical protein
VNETDQQLLEDAETLPEDLEPVELDEVADEDGEEPPPDWGEDGEGQDEAVQEGGES